MNRHPSSHCECVHMRYLRWPEVHRRLGLSKATIWRLERANLFPHRVRLAKNAVAWIESEVEEWIRERPRVYVGSVGFVRSDAG
jgi:prophage regulatory protein